MGLEAIGLRKNSFAGRSRAWSAKRLITFTEITSLKQSSSAQTVRNMVRLTVHPAAQGELTANPPRDRESPMTGEVAGEVTGEVPPNVQRLLANMDGELGRAALQDRVGIQHQDHFRLAYLRPALDAGLIEMTSPQKPQSSKQRYRLTAAGRRWRALTSPVSSN